MGTGSSKQVEEGQKKPRFSLKRSRKTKKKEEEQTAAQDRTGEEGTAKQGEGGGQATAAAVVTPEQQQSEGESKQATEVAPEQEKNKEGDQPASTSQEPAAGAPQEPQDHRDEQEGYVLATVAKVSEFGDNEWVRLRVLANTVLYRVPNACTSFEYTGSVGENALSIFPIPM